MIILNNHCRSILRRWNGHGAFVLEKKRAPKPQLGVPHLTSVQPASFQDPQDVGVGDRGLARPADQPVFTMRPRWLVPPVLSAACTLPVLLP